MRFEHLRLVSIGVLLSSPLAAQHCGDICEVPRLLDPVSPVPAYTLSPGVETASWRWLSNWWWTENGVQKHGLEQAFAVSPLRDFARRQVFVSPAGNGFLVTGNSYTNRSREIGEEPPLFVFCDPNFGVNIVDTSELLRRMIPLKKQYVMETSLAFLIKDEFLALLRDSGCIGIEIGFESLSTNYRKNVARGESLMDAAIQRLRKIKQYGLS